MVVFLHAQKTTAFENGTVEFHPDLKVEQNAHDLDVTRLEIHNVLFCVGLGFWVDFIFIFVSIRSGERVGGSPQKPIEVFFQITADS